MMICHGCPGLIFPTLSAYLRHECPNNRGLIEPDHPCRVMPTRGCPSSYAGECGARLCARYESDDETPWLAELGADHE